MSTATRRARKAGAELAAGLTLLFASISTVGFYDHVLAAYTGKGYGLLAIALSVVAFALSLRVRSPAVAVMLISAGVLMQVPPVQAMVEAGMVAVPGPILGVISFGIILQLGLAKAIGLRTRAVAGGGPPESEATGLGVQGPARLLADILPGILALSPTSAVAVIISMLALSGLHGARDSPPAKPELTSRSQPGLSRNYTG
jgi:hypothetical protein